MTTVQVGLGDRSYNILIGDNIISNAHMYIQNHFGDRRIIIITDANLQNFGHLKTLEQSLPDCSSIIIMSPGEHTKSFRHLEMLLEKLFSYNIDRDTVLIALGGGVIGDLVGFAASIALRGIDFVQIPTTLLAQIDSSVGGKTGINSVNGKNLIGSFYQPRLVLSDTTVLNTLPKRELLAGYAEMIKYSFIDGSHKNDFEWFEKHGQSIIDGDLIARQHAIVGCCQIKAHIVHQDEHESNVRAFLNLGHTFGHAFEVAGNYKVINHGEGVALGIIMAFKLSQKLGMCNSEDAERVVQHFKQIGLPVCREDVPDLVWEPEKFLETMKHDKKNKKDNIVFVLPQGIGDVEIVTDVPEKDVLGVLT